MQFISSLLLLGAVALTISTTFAREQETQQQQQKQPALRRPNTKTNTNPNNSRHSFEAREVESGVFSISVTTPADYEDATTRQRRRAQVSRRLEETQSCTLHLEDVYYHAADIKNVDEKWVCTFENYIRTSEEDGIAYPHNLEIFGDVEENKRAFKQAGAVSGQSILRWESADAIAIDEVDNKLAINANIPKEDGGAWIDVNEPVPVPVEEDADDEESDESRRRKLQIVSSTGTKKTLVIRVVGNYIGPRATISQLKEDIFGTGTSLKSQMETCSHDKLTIEPYSGPTNGVFNKNIIGGVVEIGIKTDPNGISDKHMENDAMEAAYYVFGDLVAQFDLVLFAMPPGISPGFAAYAYIGSPFSYYSNESIEDVMVQMHEIGHNLGLQHAGEGRDEDGEEYGDPSGYMGYSNVLDPKMCYNAANNYQLGWYSQFSIKPTSDDGYGGTFYMSGVAGYDSSDDTKFVSLRLEQESLTADYYIGYNWASGMNAETQEDADKIIIVEKNGAVYASEISWKKAALSVGESHVIENYDNSGKSVTIIFSNIEGNVAIIDIILESSESPTFSPSASPTAFPSVSPTAFPSALNETDNIFNLIDAYNNETGIFDLDNKYNNETDDAYSNETDIFDFDNKYNNETDDANSNETDSFDFDDQYNNETDDAYSNETDSFDFDDQYNNETEIFDLEDAHNNNETSFPSDWESTWYPTSEDTDFNCEDQSKLFINIRTDNHPEETSWTLKVKRGKNIAQVEMGTYKNRNTDYTDNFCLDYNTCYNFKIKDEGKDGGVGGGENKRVGFYEIYLDDQLIIRKEGDWGRRKRHIFCTGEMPIVIDNEMNSEIATNNVPILADGNETNATNNIPILAGGETNATR